MIKLITVLSLIISIGIIQIIPHIPEIDLGKNMPLYLLAGFFGNLLCILLNIKTLINSCKIAKCTFRLKDYIKDDWPVIIASFISVGILIVGLKELLNFKPYLAKYVTWLFVFVGFTGGSIPQAIGSAANKKILKIIKQRSDELEELKNGK